jgi:hypothetical protein
VPNSGASGKRKEALLFVNKKKQKNFKCRVMGRGANSAHGPKDQKFFGSFFKKNILTFALSPR